MSQGRRIAGLSAVVIAGALALPASGQAGEISGSWSGPVFDQGSVDPYVTHLQIKQDLERGKKGGTSDYPEFSCGGDLIYRRHDKESGAYIFTEQLTAGIENCVDGGKVKLTRKRRSLRFNWLPPDETGTPASGKLTRPNRVAAAGDEGDLYGKRYLSVEVTKDGKPYELVEGTRLWVDFSRKGEGKEVTWRAGCNYFGASAEIDGYELDVGSITSTEMACTGLMAQDRFFARFFADDPAYEAFGRHATLFTDRVTIELRPAPADQPRRLALRDAPAGPKAP